MSTTGTKTVKQPTTQRLLAACLLILGGLGSHSALAQVGPLRSGLYESSLMFFLDRPDNLMLRNSTAFGEVPIPISPRLDVRSARLHLEYTNSIALLEGRSTMRISLNDKILAQMLLQPDEPNGVVEIGLPTDLLQPEYNPLVFWVAQHYTLECEDPSAPELWTQLDVQNSYLVLDAELKTLNPTLADLGDLIDPRLWGDYRITILTAGEMRDQHLGWGSLVAQGTAARLRYKNLVVDHGQAMNRVAAPEGEGGSGLDLDLTAYPETDVVLVGTRGELAPYLSADLASRIDGAFLGIFPLDADPRYFALVVSGTDDEEVERAARAYSLATFPLPDTQATRIEEEAIPAMPGNVAYNAIHENRVYKFYDLGFETTTLTGISPGNFELSVWVPPDFFTRQDAVVEVSFHMAYGAGMRSDSVFNILLNDRFENVIHLRNVGGQVYRDYRLAIPVRSFHSGLNTFTFAPQMYPLITGECQAVQDRNLVFTLFEDSEFVTPRTAHFVELPDLRRLATTAFPYGSDGHGAEMGMQVLSRDSKTVGAAWTLMGKLAQVRSLPLWNAQISFGRPDEERNWMLVGPVDTLEPSMLEGAPIELGETLRIPYPTVIVGAPPEQPRGFFGTLVQRLKTLFVPWRTDTPQLRPEVVTLTQTGGLGRYALMMQYESPWQGNSTVTVVTAEDEELLHRRVHQVVDPGYWDVLDGDVSIWEERTAPLRTSEVGPKYKVGSISVQQRLEFSFSRYPWFWAILLLVIMVVFAAIALYLLRRYREREHQEVYREEREVIIVRDREKDEE